MTSIGNIFQETNPYEKFVQQLVQLESRTKHQLEIQKDEQQDRKQALGRVSESISKFSNTLTELQNPDNKSFEPLRTSSSNTNVVRLLSASDIDRESTYNINVERLASRDTGLSAVLQGESTGLAQNATETTGEVTLTIGDQTHTITVESQKEVDGEMVTRQVLPYQIAMERAFQPIRHFLWSQIGRKNAADVALFMRMANLPRPETPDNVPTYVLIPAFITSELKVSFEIGFIIFMPFLIIDMVTASVLMSMGMMQLPPIMISMPFKILLFVMVDGWRLLTESLMRGVLGR